jgi:hypothetical protein
MQTTKSIINHAGLPDPAALKATQDIFFQTFGWEGAKERLPKLREREIGQPGDFELNLGHYLAAYDASPGGLHHRIENLILPWQVGATLGATPKGYTRRLWRAVFLHRDHNRHRQMVEQRI